MKDRGNLKEAHRQVAAEIYTANAAAVQGATENPFPCSKSQRAQARETCSLTPLISAPVLRRRPASTPVPPWLTQARTQHAQKAIKGAEEPIRGQQDRDLGERECVCQPKSHKFAPPPHLPTPRRIAQTPSQRRPLNEDGFDLQGSESS